MRPLLLCLLCACGSSARTEPTPVATTPERSAEAPVVAPSALPSAPPDPPRGSATRVVACAPAPRPRVVFDPPGDRHSLPDLVWNDHDYLLLAYGDAQTGMVLTRLTPQGEATHVSLGVGTQPSIALGQTRLGVVVTDFDTEATRVEVPPPEPLPPGVYPPTPPPGAEPHERPDHLMIQQGQTYFFTTTRAGDAPTPRVAIGDPTANHTTPGTSIGWNPRLGAWGLAWTEDMHARFASVAANGSVSPVLDLSDGAQAYHDDARVVATTTGFAVPIQLEGRVILVEIERGAVVRRTEIARDVLEPEAAFDGERIAVLVRTATELDVVFVQGGRASSRHTIARAEQGRHIGAPEIAFDGSSFVVVWPSGASGFDDRLCLARLDGQGAPIAGHPVRIDDEDVHQGYASMAGTGESFAVSYVLGDPNGAVRVGLVRGL